MSVENTAVTSAQAQADSNIALSVRDLKKAVMLKDQRLEILKGISLEIKRGESVAIVGRSGSGKTTLLGLLAGLDLPSGGQVSLFGDSLEDMDEDERARLRSRHVGFVFQSFHLIPSMTALENVMLPMELIGEADARDKASHYLTDLGLGDRMDHFPPQLSGGEQQRVALARAFACQPSILFADEPTGNLDTATGKVIIDLLFQLNDTHGTTLVMVTHDPALAERCQHTVTIEDGLLLDTAGKAPEAGPTSVSKPLTHV